MEIISLNDESQQKSGEKEKKFKPVPIDYFRCIWTGIRKKSLVCHVSQIINLRTFPFFTD